MADQGDGTGTAWIEPAGGTASAEFGDVDVAAAAPSISAMADGNNNIPIPLPTPTPQAPYVDTSSNSNGNLNAAVGGIPSRTKGGFGIPIPPDTRNQGGISLKASELPRSFGRGVRACTQGMSFVWYHRGLIFRILGLAQ